MVSMANPWKDPKTGMYGLRKAVPAELQSIIGKTVIKKSYKTKDPKEAKRIHIAELAKAEALIENARAGGISLSLRHKEALAGEWLQTALRTDEQNRAKGIVSNDEEQSSDEGGAYGLNIDFLHEALETGKKAEHWVLNDIIDTLSQRAVPIAAKRIKDDTELVNCFLKAKYTYYLTLKNRSEGKWSEPDYSKYPEFTLETIGAPKPTKGTSFEELWTRWTLETKNTPKTQDEYLKYWEEFLRLHGALGIQYINEDHVREYKAHLVDKKQLKPGTINKRLSALKTLLGYAKREGYIRVNPAEGFTVEDRQHSIDKRSPFTRSELQKIFGSDIYTKDYRPRGGGGEACYWIPLIALYTGARLNETGRLLCKDVGESNGVYYFELHNAQKGQRGKGRRGNPRKIVPVHSALIERGFIDYLKKTYKNDTTPLFPELTNDRYGNPTGNWSKWWGRWLREALSIEDETKVFHSFRHSFIQECREKGIPTDRRNAMTGHVSKEAVDNYGGWKAPENRSYPFSPSTLKVEIEKLNFFDLAFL